jgi:PEP-CTERM motif
MMLASRRQTVCAVIIASFGFFAMAGVAQAVTIADNLLAGNVDVSIYLKGNPNGSQLPDLGAGVEQDIFLVDTPAAVTTGYGRIGSNGACPVGGPCVNFTSTSLIKLSNGNANIKPDGDTFHDLTISVPGFQFGDLLFGIQLQKDDVPKDTPDPIPLYDLTITVKNGATTIGEAILTDPTVDNSGLMSFLVLGENSPITSVMLSSTFGIDGAFGFAEIKSFDISEVQRLSNEGGIGETPLPGTLPLFATGLGLLGLLGWRKKRKAAALS